MAYRILIVEDEPDTRELLEFTLRWAGHDIEVAAGGREALELLAGRSYDVIPSKSFCSAWGTRCTLMSLGYPAMAGISGGLIAGLLLWPRER